MKLKLDENLDVRLASSLSQAGHEVTTVRDQGLAGIDDQALYVRCRSESRTLVTVDLDFANVLRYTHFLPTLRILTETLMRARAEASPAGQLWIVEPGRVRIHESPSEQ